MVKKVKLILGDLSIRIVKFLAKKAKIDLIRLAYSENGITKSQSFKASGELFFIERFLKQNVKSKTPIFFDIGANSGAYSRMLRDNFVEASILSFEPNPHTFNVLETNLIGKVELFNLGVGAKKSIMQLYYDANNKTSVQATVEPKILTEISKTTSLESKQIDVITLDDFCSSKGIKHIDLLKIDTEGFELEVIKGAKKLLETHAIQIIQFEFNEVNVIKRRFLKDFYELLPEFVFYRLDENKLIPLCEWQPIHEIFMFQNICAIRK